MIMHYLNQIFAKRYHQHGDYIPYAKLNDREFVRLSYNSLDDLPVPSTVLQDISVYDGANISTTTIMPVDTTTPQDTEGMSILSVDFTPLSADSTLIQTLL